MRKVLSRLRSTIPVIRTTWAIVGLTLIVLGLSEGGLRLVFWLKDLRGVPSLPDRRVLERGYHNEAWAIDHFRELASLADRGQPVLYVRQQPFTGQTIHTDSDGCRATWTARVPAPSPPGPKPIKITFLGGSSLWGFGARDDHTIPSHVAKELDRRGVAAEVRNLAEIGYVNSQELIALIGDLQGGRRPDYVIFYDGVNDTTSALLEGTAGVSTNESNRRHEFNILHSPGRLIGNFLALNIKESALLRLAQSIRRRLGSRITKAYPNPSPDEQSTLAGDVVMRYQANINLVQQLGRAYGFRPLFFWQPTVFNKPKRLPFEVEEKEKFAWSESMFETVYGQIRDEAGLKLDPTFHDLSGIFADESDLVFIDYCHTTESANARIASAIAEALARAMNEGAPAPKPHLK
jgi:lysophospholipase L1-like esterase